VCWPLLLLLLLQADLLSLVAPGVPAASKLDLLARMMRTYALLQP
jgi:hypothetical protein